MAMGALLFVLTWTLLSLPIGILVGKIIAEPEWSRLSARLFVKFRPTHRPPWTV
jgi:hypothetical protein